MLKLEQAVIEIRALEPSSSKAHLVKRGQLTRVRIEKPNGWLRKGFGLDVINWWPGAFYVNKFHPVGSVNVYPPQIGPPVRRISKALPATGRKLFREKRASVPFRKALHPTCRRSKLSIAAKRSSSVPPGPW